MRCRVESVRLGVVAIIVGGLLACGSAPEPAPAPAVPEPEAIEALGKLNPADLEAEADKKYALVPSPLETQAAMLGAGIDTQLAGLVPSDRGFNLAEADTDRVAVRTGVVMADLLLTARTSPDAQLIAQLGAIRVGMESLSAGKDFLATIDDLSQRVQAGALDRDALLKELEELSQVAIPELEFNGVARVVPLIQAGSWTAGANLVGRATLEKNTPAAADPILKQPAVVSYFTAYARENAEGAVPSEVATALQIMLAKLREVSEKSEPLNADDVQIVVDATTVVLSLL